MPEPYQRPVARLWRGGEVVGAGFLAPRGVVVTCAHVVNHALGRDTLCQDEPDDAVAIDLPWAAGTASFRGSILDWRPPIPSGVRRPFPCVDIAVLQLDHQPPGDAELSPQAPAPVPEDAAFRVMGFPEGSDAGAPARGTVRATDADGWHHVEADRGFGRTMEPGFSGAPAIADDPAHRLLGMIDVTNSDERRGVLIPVEALMRAWPPLAKPYRGLEAFREEDAAYFFGRDMLKDRLWRSFERNPVTLLTGPSGSGKSSLLNAGFLPRLRQQGGWRLVRMRPGGQPVKRLASGLAQALDPGLTPMKLAENTATLRSSLLARQDSLLDYAEALHESCGKSICLIVDQFEETFTLAKPADPAEYKAFLTALVGVTRQRESFALKALLGMRVDFQANLQGNREAPELVEALDGDPTVQMHQMKPTDLAQVIRGPLAPARLDVALDDELFSQLLSDLASNADALPLLEFVLGELWGGMEIDRRRRSLSSVVYDRLGGMSGAIARHADAALAELEIDEGLAKRLFVELVRVGASVDHDTRWPRSKAELDVIDPRLWPIAQGLANRRLLVTGDGPGVDIVHEALFRQWRRLADWIEGERDFLRWRQRLEERRREWDEAGRNTADLLSGNALHEASRWLASHQGAVDQRQLEYIRGSVAAEAANQSLSVANALWDRIELNWDDKIPEHELEALLELGGTSPEVRLQFLRSAIVSVPKARRLARRPNIVCRAALGLDRTLAAHVSDMLVDLALPEPALQPEQIWALTVISLSVAHMVGGHLAHSLIKRAAEAIPSTISSYQLRASGEIVRAFAERVDADAARALVQRAAEAIPSTTSTGQLQAYGEIVRAFAERVDPVLLNDAARALVQRAAEAIPSTTSTGQLQAYGEIVRAFAERVDPVLLNDTARALVERAAEAIPSTTSTGQLQAYGEIVRAFAERVDPVLLNDTARALVERAAEAIPSTTSTGQLQAYGEIVRAFAERVDPVLLNDTARTLVERAAEAILSTTDTGQLRAYGEIVRAFTDCKEAELANRANRALVERAIHCMQLPTSQKDFDASIEIVLAAAEKLPSSAATHILIYMLKHPLAGRRQPTNQLIDSLMATIYPDMIIPDDFWEVIEIAGGVETALPLAAPYSHPDDILAEFRRRLDADSTPPRR